MQVDQPLRLLGGLTPQQFMHHHWHQRPLLVRGAVPAMQPLLARQALFALAGHDGVESRLVQQPQGRHGWRMRQGPLPRQALPPLSQPGWTLLLQGMDLHDDGVHALLQQFRFVPDARLDDLMISYATDGGGVGPHVDSYDVFLLQAQGQRRWRIGQQADLSLRDDVPLKVLAHFDPDAEFVLEPGDMLYLPPGYAHDGVAVGECMTYSIGFRAPTRGELAAALLARLADDPEGAWADRRYADRRQPAVDRPGCIPETMAAFAREAVQRALAEPDALQRVLGEYLTEPKSGTWFDAGVAAPDAGQANGVVLDRRTRMAYDARHVFINGESFRAGGRDATLMHRLADERALDARTLLRASTVAKELLEDWLDAGWLHRASTAA